MRKACSGLDETIFHRVPRLGLSLKEAQALANIGRNTLLRLLRSGQVRGRKIGTRRWVVCRDSLEAWLRGNN